jgi:hypothetical protein
MKMVFDMHWVWNSQNTASIMDHDLTTPTSVSWEQGTIASIQEKLIVKIANRSLYLIVTNK